LKTADLDELDAAPPAAFIRTRNALAERLRKAGRTREATEVRRRRRPSVALWLVNRLARVDPDGVRGLLEAADRLRRASLRDRRAIPDATARHRTALQQLMRGAERILADPDIRPSPEVLRRVHATLSGAAADRSTHADLRRGRLSREIEPGGFEVLGGVPAGHLRLVEPARRSGAAATAKGKASTDARPRTRRQQAESRAQRNAAERQRREAERRARREAEARRREAAKREAETARRQRAIDRATRTADRLRERLRQAEQRIERERRGGGRIGAARPSAAG